MLDNTMIKDRMDAEAKASALMTQRLGALASFLLAVAFFVPPGIYLTGNLRDASGILAYGLADFLYGPVWAASLVVAVFALRERIGEFAQRRMTLALLAALLAAGAMVAVACIRSANRHYHLMHPELHLEDSSMVLTVWATLVAGMTGAGLHFLGWSFVLIGSAGWTTRRLPRALSALYVLVGVTGLFTYRSQEMDVLEMNIVVLGVVLSIWQGIVLWRTEPGGTQAPEISASQPDQA